MAATMTMTPAESHQRTLQLVTQSPTPRGSASASASPGLGLGSGGYTQPSPLASPAPRPGTGTGPGAPHVHDTAWLLSALSPSSSRADKAAAAREIRQLVRTADETYWRENCAQVWPLPPASLSLHTLNSRSPPTAPSLPALSTNIL
jgi:hypothetical protein